MQRCDIQKRVNFSDDMETQTQVRVKDPHRPRKPLRRLKKKKDSSSPQNRTKKVKAKTPSAATKPSPPSQKHREERNAGEYTWVMLPDGRQVFQKVQLAVLKAPLLEETKTETKTKTSNAAVYYGADDNVAGTPVKPTFETSVKPDAETPVKPDVETPVKPGVETSIEPREKVRNGEKKPRRLRCHRCSATFKTFEKFHEHLDKAGHRNKSVKAGRRPRYRRDYRAKKTLRRRKQKLAGKTNVVTTPVRKPAVDDTQVRELADDVRRDDVAPTPAPVKKTPHQSRGRGRGRGRKKTVTKNGYVKKLERQLIAAKAEIARLTVEEKLRVAKAELRRLKAERAIARKAGYLLFPLKPRSAGAGNNFCG
eukprot:g1187.t1